LSSASPDVGCGAVSVEGDEELERVELGLLTEALLKRTGVDVRGHAHAKLRRRILGAALGEGVKTISGLQERVLHDRAAMERLIAQLPLAEPSLYRDPTFFVALRERVIPHLRSYPFARIWHAGCGTGEEVYALQVLLAEEGLLERCRVYATERCEAALGEARAGRLPLAVVEAAAEAYARAGGRSWLADHYSIDADGAAVFHAQLCKGVLFSEHALETDGSFNEFNLILCRNVIDCFGVELSAHVHRLLYRSLRRFGVLALGRTESLRGTPHEGDYEVIDADERLFRRRA
jgi:chemotaxis protein methyltransferase CheR